MDLKQLAYDLTMSTVEVEDVEVLAERFEGLVVGEIKEVLPHPNADKLRVCKVDIGADEIKDIVCGGSNLEVGQKVCVAVPGAMVKWHGEGEPVEIKASKLRGVESFGMICASTEVGLEELMPCGDHEIMNLNAFDCKAGDSLADALDLNDVILEIDNKSMTNRPDMWGHYGMAREIATLYDLPLAEIPAFELGEVAEADVRIEDAERCRRMTGTKIEGLSVKPSPFYMQSRLWRVGLRPINALVDITNYAMMATGQPSHAYDLDHIHDFLGVRKAVEGEHLTLLNDEDLPLVEDDLVIVDSTGPVGLAGVMGGKKDSILDTTHRVLLEIANFEPKGIRRVMQRYDSRTDAATRYE